MGKIKDTLKQASRALARPVEKFHDSRVVRAIDRFMYKPVRRIPVAVATSLGLNLAGGAGAAGVLLGRGETLVQKIGDAITAIPRGMANSIEHYLNAPEYARKADAALQYLRERGASDAETIGRATRYIESGINQVRRGMDYAQDGLAQIIPGGKGNFDPIEGYHSIRDGLEAIRVGAENIGTGKDRAIETAGPAIEALKNVDLNPVMQALHNLADNLATDEIGYTLSVAAASMLAASTAAAYLGGYWGRRGRPGIISRFIQRRGLKRFRNYYRDNPDKIAGEEGIRIFEESLARNPKRLESLAERAGYNIVQRNP